uniref:Ciliary BBSome complex subunit 2 N-terminal domain-containing protein n=1 Tax=Branchiostoma floridae TaxID=7739 RepID=C3XRD0_BRAFL|eukprot:XP_002613239.1 hypothetical protein BRAFLDRAFT_118696 [Branchiostoma floridae]
MQNDSLTCECQPIPKIERALGVLVHKMLCRVCRLVGELIILLCKRTIPSQVALGGEDGSIYIMSNFQVSVVEYSNVKLPLTQLVCVQDSMPGQEDFILCAGHFNNLFVYKAGKRVCQHKTPDWIVSMATADVDRDGNVEVVVGCLDNSVQALKMTTSSKFDLKWHYSTVH